MSTIERTERDKRIIFFLAGHIPANVNAEAWISKGTFGEQKSPTPKKEEHDPEKYSIESLAMQGCTDNDFEDKPDGDFEDAPIDKAVVYTAEDTANSIQENWLRRRIKKSLLEDKQDPNIREDLLCRIEDSYLYYIEKSYKKKNIRLRNDIMNASENNIHAVLIKWRSTLAKLQLKHIISDILRETPGTYQYIYRKIQTCIYRHRRQCCYPKGGTDETSRYYGKPNLTSCRLVFRINTWQNYKVPENCPLYKELFINDELQGEQLMKLLDGFNKQFFEYYDYDQAFPIRDFTCWVMSIYGLYEEEINESSFMIFNQNEQKMGSIFDRLDSSSSNYEDALRQDEVDSILKNGTLTLDDKLHRLQALLYLDDDHTHFILEACIRVNKRLIRQPVRKIRKRDLLTLESRGVTRGIDLADILGCQPSNITEARNQISNCIREELKNLREKNCPTLYAPSQDNGNDPDNIDNNDIELVAALFQYMPRSEISAAVVNNFAPFAVKMNITL